MADDGTGARSIDPARFRLRPYDRRIGPLVRDAARKLHAIDADLGAPAAALVSIEPLIQSTFTWPWLAGAQSAVHLLPVVRLGPHLDVLETAQITQHRSAAGLAAELPAPESVPQPPVIGEPSDRFDGYSPEERRREIRGWARDVLREAGLQGLRADMAGLSARVGAIDRQSTAALGVAQSAREDQAATDRTLRRLTASVNDALHAPTA